MAAVSNTVSQTISASYKDPALKGTYQCEISGPKDKVEKSALAMQQAFERVVKQLCMADRADGKGESWNADVHRNSVLGYLNAHATANGLETIYKTTKLY